MLVEIANKPRDYAWGSTHAIADLLGRSASGGPEAELWLGAHPLSPATVVDPSRTGGATDLAEWIDRDPLRVIGKRESLPFLLKVLAASTALSIQVHPSAEQARLGFDRENAAGIPIGAPQRNYRDSSHKPELIFCLSPTFEALCGFRAIDASRSVFRSFIEEGQRAGLETSALMTVEAELQKSEHSVRTVVELILDSDTGVGQDAAHQLVGVARIAELASAIEHEAALVLSLGAEYPEDPGIAVALLMNHLSLRPGQALFVPHGVMHAYLSGLGIEIMATSDNVLRGGLTKKHVDVAELLRVGVFAPSAPALVAPQVIDAGVTCFSPGVAEFELIHVLSSKSQAQAEVLLGGPAIVLCIAGNGTISGQQESSAIHRGQSFMVTADEAALRVSGDLEVFVARTGS